MGIFRVKLAGRDEPFLVKGDTAAKVKDSLVEAKALTAKELADAFGAPVWEAGQPLPPVPAAPPAAEPPAEAE